jgi:hypothetical protein
MPANVIGATKPPNVEVDGHYSTGSSSAADHDELDPHDYFGAHPTFSVTNTPAPGTPTVGQQKTYTVGTSSNRALYHPELTFSIPSGTSFASTTFKGCGLAGGTLTCHFPAGTKSFSGTVVLTMTAAGATTTTATVNADNADTPKFADAMVTTNP